MSKVSGMLFLEFFFSLPDDNLFIPENTYPLLIKLFFLQSLVSPVR